MCLGVDWPLLHVEVMRSLFCSCRSSSPDCLHVLGGRAAHGKLNMSCISSFPDPPAPQDAPQPHSAHHHPDDIIGVG